jgi:hypothetical protein
MQAFWGIFIELFSFLRGHPLTAVLLFSPLSLLFAALAIRDYGCLDSRLVVWALAASIPASGTLIRLCDREAASFLVGERWSLAVFMGMSLALNAMLAGAVIPPYWLTRVLISPACG